MHTKSIVFTFYDKNLIISYKYILGARITSWIYF